MYLVDVLHTRTRTIYQSMQDQANEQNDQAQSDCDLQTTQSAVVQHNTQPVALHSVPGHDMSFINTNNPIDTINAQHKTNQHRIA